MKTYVFLYTLDGIKEEKIDPRWNDHLGTFCFDIHPSAISLSGSFLVDENVFQLCFKVKHVFERRI